MFELKDAENKLITIALAKTEGNRHKAAKLLGISENTLRRRINERISADALEAMKEAE